MVRQRWNVELLQHGNGKEMNMSSYTPSPSPQQCESCTKTSAQRKQSRTRREKTGKSISCNVGSGEKLIEEAENVCARPHSGIRLSVINEVNQDSTEEKDDNKRNLPNNETAIDNEEARIGGSGFSVPSLKDSCEDDIDSAIGGGLLIYP